MLSGAYKILKLSAIIRACLIALVIFVINPLIKSAHEPNELVQLDKFYL
jgi:hypothetical protein